MDKKHAPRFLDIVSEAKQQVKECHVQDVKQMLDAEKEFVLVDVREESEWNEGRIPGAIHLGKGVIERDIEKTIPDTNTTIVLYCGGGYRSALAAWSLQRMGYCNVISMDGGYKGWKDAGLPVGQS
ncbi:MAG: rhodanese-like domain-containing protein [Planctomycetaceae bacterium]